MLLCFVRSRIILDFKFPEYKQYSSVRKFLITK